MGIEPTPSAWEAEVLPLNYTRIEIDFPGFHATCKAGTPRCADRVAGLEVRISLISPPPAVLIHLMTAPISIELNGLATTVDAGSTLADLLIREDLIERRIAVEYNGEIVPRSAYGNIRLASGDRLEVVHAIGGGAL